MAEHHRSARYNDPFRWHKLALMPAGRNLTPAALDSTLSVLDRDDQRRFFEFLHANDLGPWWYSLAQSGLLGSDVPEHFLAELRKTRFASTATYLAQEAAVQQLDQVFRAQAIAYAVIKGVHVRELVYEEPALRPASDIDILVLPRQRESAARALIEGGFAFHPDVRVISHEAAFTRDAVTVDLHWDILRPGRTRTNIAERLLQHRQRVDGFWGLSDTDTVFLMLVHPAFAKHVCAPRMGLSRVLDFLLWVRTRETDWDSVADRLQSAGLETAAWTVLTWFSMLVQDRIEVPASFLEKIRPGAIRMAYLRAWLKNDLPTRWQRHWLRVQLGFTLFLHDKMPDARRAMLGWWRARRARYSDTLLRLSEPQA